MANTLATRLGASLLVGALTFGQAFGAQSRAWESDGSGRLEAVEIDSTPKDRSWPILMGSFGLAVGADALSTRWALRKPGVVEGNPLYSWAGPDGAVALRIAAGVGAGFGLNVLHRSRPKTARALAILAIVAGGLAARHNWSLSESPGAALAERACPRGDEDECRVTDR